MNLEELKKSYSILEKKYQLPSFAKLNEEYGIESIRKYKETLVKSVRKLMMEKLVNTMALLEMLLNPVNAPRVYFAYLKSMTNEDKRDLDKLYGKLADITLETMPLEIDYSEKGEAEMIRRIDKFWDEMKPDLRKLFSKMQHPVSSPTKEKSYFG